MTAIEGEAAFGSAFRRMWTTRTGRAQHSDAAHALDQRQHRHFPAGSARQLAGYLTGGVGMLQLLSRTAPAMVFG